MDLWDSGHEGHLAEVALMFALLGSGEPPAALGAQCWLLPSARWQPGRQHCQS
jgi:hypothetical protein